LGAGRNSSNEGIHAASIGGIWQCVVFGFGGVRMINGELRIEPRLPEKWIKLEFELNWKNQKLFIRIETEHFTIQNITGMKDISFINKKVEYRTNKNKVYEIKTNCAK
jgi:hypothetical glycosyl hydrolase